MRGEKESSINCITAGLVVVGLGAVLNVLLQESVQLFVAALAVIVFILGYGIFFMELSQNREQR